MYSFFKRAFDIVFAVCFLVILSPIYILTSIGIYISNPGPVFYKAERVGKNGKVFTCYKFRSMVVNSGKIHLTTLRNDDRIFPFGKFIRKTKIDEMPQAFNILIGNMSVVGPRPEDYENASEMYKGKYTKILDVKPGLTSPASLYDYTYGEKYEDEELYYNEFVPQKLELELYYVKNRNVWYDLGLVFKTALYIIEIAFGRDNFPIPSEMAALKSEKTSTEVLLER